MRQDRQLLGAVTPLGGPGIFLIEETRHNFQIWDWQAQIWRIKIPPCPKWMTVAALMKE